MNNSRKRSKPKRDNLSEGGEGMGSLMQIEEQSINNLLFWKDNKSWYQQPIFHHFSPNMSEKYSNLQKQANEDHQIQSDRIAYNGSSQVRSQIHLSHIRMFERLSNKSERSSFKDNLLGKLKTDVGCKCTKVSCLKRTCGCFDQGKYCGQSCTCEGCKNVEGNKSQIQKAKVEAKLRSHRSIFDNVQHEVPTKVCTCPKSRCQKKYCECYQAGVPCNEFCKCLNCKNTVQYKKHQKYQNGSTIQKSSYQKSVQKEMFVQMQQF